MFCSGELMMKTNTFVKHLNVIRVTCEIYYLRASSCCTELWTGQIEHIKSMNSHK